jgi:3-dehydroquinate synthase
MGGKRMAGKRLQVAFGEMVYDIVLERSFDGLIRELEGFKIESRRLCILTDDRVGSLYGGELRNILDGKCRKVITAAFPHGEGSKTLDTVREVYRTLIEEEFDRGDMILALGGGVVGDMAGFAAATYLRGIDYVQIPTTLLAQTDSSIGGKTGVDFDGYKNMVGAFLMPKLVYMNVSALQTLDSRQFFNGFAEVMKAGLIRDLEFYLWLIDHLYEIHDRDTEILEEMILRSCGIKKAVVEADPLERGERAILNFGHTIGHALEKASDFRLLHGEAVALGMVAAAFISWKKELLTKEEYYEVRDMMVPFCLPITMTDMVPEDVVELVGKDKKKTGTQIKFILLEGIGNAVINMQVSKEDMLEAVKEICGSDEF